MCSYGEDLLAGSSQQDGAGFGVFALSDEGEIFITDLFHLKQPRPHANVFLAQLVSPTDDASSARPERERDSLKTCPVGCFLCAAS